MNKGAYCGLIFKLLTYAKSIWVTCIKEYSLKRKLFWTIEIPPDSSWVFRGLLKHKILVRKLIKYLVANGEDIYLCHDIVWDSTQLLESEKVVQYVNLPLNAKVSDFITENEWNDWVLNLPNGDLRDSILITLINHLLDKDEII